MAEYLEKYDREATETEKKEQKTDRRAEEDKNSGVRVIILCEFVIADVCARARVCVCACEQVCMYVCMLIYVWCILFSLCLCSLSQA